jgi:periplasmic divalent cation tolerance protein
VVLKTTDLMYKRVEQAIRERHSYELPAIYALPVEQIYEPYATWLAGGSRGE